MKYFSRRKLLGGLLSLLLIATLASCSISGTAKRVQQDGKSAIQKVKNVGICNIVNTLVESADQFKAAAGNSELQQAASNQAGNALESLKSLVPEDIKQAVTDLRASDAPLDATKDTPNQKVARAKVQAYFKSTCGKTI